MVRCVNILAVGNLALFSCENKANIKLENTVNQKEVVNPLKVLMKFEGQGFNSNQSLELFADKYPLPPSSTQSDSWCFMSFK